MIILIIAVSWLLVCGLSFPAILQAKVNACPYNRHQVGENTVGQPVFITCSVQHKEHAIWNSLIGPFILPFALGSTLSRVLTPTSKDDKVEAKRQAELDDAKHKLELAKIEAEQIKVLEGNLNT